MSAMQGPPKPGKALEKLNYVKDQFSEIEPWLRQITEPPPPFVKEPKKIIDRVGLADLLSQIPDFKITKGDLYSLKRGTGPADANIEHILALSKAISKPDAKDANYPPNLFSSFIFPRVPNVVLLRSGEDDYCDLSSVKGFESNDKDVKYWAPRFNLVGSDVAINVIEIPCKKMTAFNKHPGFELAFPIEGKIEVEFESGASVTADSEAEEYAHYSSDQSHRVAQRGDKQARVLVVRFFEYARLHLNRSTHRKSGDISNKKGEPGAWANWGPNK